MTDFIGWVINSLFGGGQSLLDSVLAGVEYCLLHIWHMVALGGGWFLDVVISGYSWWIGNVLRFWGYLAGWLIGQLPSSISGPLTALYTSIQSGMLRDLLKVVWYISSFFVDPHLLLGCITFISGMWLFAVLTHLAFWIKGHIWSASH